MNKLQTYEEFDKAVSSNKSNTDSYENLRIYHTADHNKKNSYTCILEVVSSNLLCLDTNQRIIGIEYITQSNLPMHIQRRFDFNSYYCKFEYGSITPINVSDNKKYKESVSFIITNTNKKYIYELMTRLINYTDITNYNQLRTITKILDAHIHSSDIVDIIISYLKYDINNR